MDRQTLVTPVTTKIHTVEEALDEALSLMSGLPGELVGARREAGLAATVGQEVFENLSDAIGHVMQARGALVNSHRGLDKLRRAMRLSPSLDTPVDKPDEIAPVQAREPVRLRQVNG